MASVPVPTLAGTQRNENALAQHEFEVCCYSLYIAAPHTLKAFFLLKYRLTRQNSRPNSTSRRITSTIRTNMQVRLLCAPLEILITCWEEGLDVRGRGVSKRRDGGGRRAPLISRPDFTAVVLGAGLMSKKDYNEKREVPASVRLSSPLSLHQSVPSSLRPRASPLQDLINKSTKSVAEQQADFITKDRAAKGKEEEERKAREEVKREKFRLAQGKRELEGGVGGQKPSKSKKKKPKKGGGLSFNEDDD